MPHAFECFLTCPLQLAVKLPVRFSPGVQGHMHIVAQPHPKAVFIADSAVWVTEIDMSMVTVQTVGRTGHDAFLFILHD